MFTKNLYNSNFFRTKQIKQFKSTHFIDDTNLIFCKSNDGRQNPQTKRYFEHCLTQNVFTLDLLQSDIL